jgi:phage head maturation protease
MRFYWPIAKVDAEQRMVWGYASTEAKDEQGEIVTREALSAALDDYMRFANIREMHQPSAIGIAREASVDDKGLYLGAKIVDGAAWQKVVEGVYKGFSIGGRVTARDPDDRKVITGVTLTEISVVDRPANPEAVFDCWKLAADAELDAGPAALATRWQEPVQIWDCGVAGHRHVQKADALRCLDRAPPGPPAPASAMRGEPAFADPGYQPDGRQRYPLDGEAQIRAAWAFIHQAGNARPYSADQLAQIKARIIAAWRAVIDPAGPPAATGEVATGRPPAPDSPEQVRRLAQLVGDQGYALAGGETTVAAAAIPAGRQEPRPELAPLAEMLARLEGAIMPRLEALQKRVDEIARTPLPAQAMARSFSGIAKCDDGRTAVTASDDIVAALARMSAEERTLVLIKAAHANPRHPG